MALIFQLTMFPQCTIHSCLLLECVSILARLTSTPIPTDVTLDALNDVTHSFLLHGEVFTLGAWSKCSLLSHELKLLIELAFLTTFDLLTHVT